MSLHNFSSTISKSSVINIERFGNFNSFKNYENGNIFFTPEIVLKYLNNNERNNDFLELNKNKNLENYYSEKTKKILNKKGDIIVNSYLIKDDISNLIH